VAGGPWRRRLRGAEGAAACVRNGDVLGLPLTPGQPMGFLAALAARDDLRTLDVVVSLARDPFPLAPLLAGGGGVRLLSGFWGPVERALSQAGHAVHFVPSDFRRYGRLLERRGVRVFATQATPPDAAGWMSLSLHAGGTVDVIRRVARDPDRTLVVEMNPLLPRTLGLPPRHRHAIHVDEADVLLQHAHPPWILAETAPSSVEQAIARHVRAVVPEGATLQTGIGAMPNDVASLLAEGDGGDYGIHSEMFTSGLMRLHQAGKVSNRKGLHDGVSVCTFAAGGPALHAWLDGNLEVRFLPVEVLNEPAGIARNRRMVSINAALAVDLHGQVTADAIAGRQHSGTGGHEDFVAGASFSRGGRSLVCLPSTATIAGRRVSRIVSRLPAGGIVTTPRHQVDTIVTEHGVAELRGRSAEERARALVAIAHPDFRDALAADAAPDPVLAARPGAQKESTASMKP